MRALHPRLGAGTAPDAQASLLQIDWLSQGLITGAAYFLKPAYILLSLAVVVLLADKKFPDLSRIRLAMLTGSRSPGACTATIRRSVRSCRSLAPWVFFELLAAARRRETLTPCRTTGFERVWQRRDSRRA